MTVDGLLNAVAADGRMHTTFNQTIAATGRLSSTEPNLQNIPIRTDAGRQIRDAFVVGVRDGDRYAELMTADYSQIEMRIMAHLSRDEGLIEAFNTGEDLHSFVASRAFGVPIDEVTAELRRRVKAMSYGLAYGLSAYGLAAQLKISTEEAKGQMDQYFARFGGVRDYLQSVVDQARKDGYTSTVLGRRRYLPELDSSNRNVREAAERAALNAPIQGSAADIIKVAMISVDAALRDAGLKSRMLLQVHDELLLEVADGRARAGRGAGRRQDGRRIPAGRAAGGVGRLRPQLGRRRALGSGCAESGQRSQHGRGGARRTYPLGLLVEQCHQPWVREAAVDAVLHKSQLDDLSGEILDGFRRGLSAYPAGRGDRQLPVADAGQPGRLVGCDQPGRHHAGQFGRGHPLFPAAAGDGEPDDQPEDRHHPEHVDQEIGLQPISVEPFHSPCMMTAAAYPSRMQPVLATTLRRCSAKYTPMPVIVVNSGWANGAMISRIAAVTSVPLRDSPLEMYRMSSSQAKPAAVMPA